MELKGMECIVRRSTGGVFKRAETTSIVRRRLVTETKRVAFRWSEEIMSEGIVPLANDVGAGPRESFSRNVDLAGRRA
jgi:hypothetical protein